MKRITLFRFFFAAALLTLATSCKDKKELPVLTGDVPIVSQFVYDGMSAYYLWNEEMLDKKPTSNDTDPEKYFESILYKTDTEKGWSWITRDVQSLVSGFAGQQFSFGYSLTFLSANQAGTEFLAMVKYVYPNSPAEKAGIKRLDIIGKVDGSPITGKITEDGYIQFDNDKLFGNNAIALSIYKFTDSGIELDREVTVTPGNINTDPVLFDKVFAIGDKKIGYLFYTSYIANFNYRLHEVFSRFKQEGVTDLVLDLRYNGGGGINAASYLVSLFAPETEVRNKTTLVKMKYNTFLNQYFDKRGGRDVAKLGEYQEEDEQNGDITYKAAPNPLTANLNLSKVYIIATGNSASASELTLFCSRAIMGEPNVVHIGEKTYGKYTASWTLHPYDEDLGVPVYEESKLSESDKNALKNWAMQPIVAIFSDKNEQNFMTPGYLNPDYSFKEGFGYVDYWKPLGDPQDVFLGQALYLITGDASYKPVSPSLRSAVLQKKTFETHEVQPLILDKPDVNSADFREIMRDWQNFRK